MAFTRDQVEKSIRGYSASRGGLNKGDLIQVLQEYNIEATKSLSVKKLREQLKEQFEKQAGYPPLDKVKYTKNKVSQPTEQFKEQKRVMGMIDTLKRMEKKKFQVTEENKAKLKQPIPSFPYKKEEKTTGEIVLLRANQFCVLYRGTSISLQQRDEYKKNITQDFLDQFDLYGQENNIFGHLLSAEQVLGTLFLLYDQYFFSGNLESILVEKNSTLDFALNPRMTKTAGLCSRRGCKYTITVAEKIFSSLFKDDSKEYLSNGLRCYNQLECLMNVFEHELIHFIFQLTCREKEKSHGPIFRLLASNIFGHTQYRHNLGRDAEGQGWERAELKKQNWKFASYKDTDGEIKTGQILKYNPVRLSLMILDQSRERGCRQIGIPYSWILHQKPNEDFWFGKFLSCRGDPGEKIKERMKKENWVFASFMNKDQKITGRILKLNPKKVKLETADGIWNVRYRAIFPADEEGTEEKTEKLTDLYEKFKDNVVVKKVIPTSERKTKRENMKEKMKREQWKYASFIHEGQTISGKIERFGPKRVKLRTVDKIWRVSYRNVLPEQPDFDENTIQKKDWQIKGEQIKEKLKQNRNSVVQFPDENGEMTVATVRRLNPKTARVVLGDSDIYYNVPYYQLYIIGN